MEQLFDALPFWIQVALVVVPGLSAVVAAIGLGLNVVQLRRNSAQNRAAIVSACLKGFADDEEIQKIFYTVEYDEFIYDDHFHRSPWEREIDKALRHFSNLALAWQAGLLTTQDVRPAQYYVLVLVRNVEIKKYLAYLDQCTRDEGFGGHPFQSLIAMSEELVSKLQKEDAKRERKTRLRRVAAAFSVKSLARPKRRVEG